MQLASEPEQTSETNSLKTIIADGGFKSEFESERHALLAQLEAVLQNASDGIIVSDPVGNLLLWNPSGLAMHGYKELAEVRRHLSEFALTFALYPSEEGIGAGSEDEPLPLADWPMSRLIRGEAFVDYKLLVHRLDTDTQWLASYSGTIAHGTDGKANLLVLTIRDISERKRTEQFQRESLDAFQTKSHEVTSILESITDAFFALDEFWCFTYVNAEAERALLHGSGTLIGKNIWEAFPAAVGSDFEIQYRRAAKERVTSIFQAYYPPPLDSWYDMRVYPSPTGAGLSVYFRNINEERRKEEERENLLAEQDRLLAALEVANSRQKVSLKRSEERFRLLVEGVQDYAIFMLDPDGRVTTWNAGAQRFKGYKADEIIGQHFSRFYTQEDIAKRHPWAELEIAEREGRYEEEGWRVRKDGSWFWASVVITALRDEEGQLRGFGKVTRDFTERREREHAIASSLALEQQRRFLKDILVSVTQGKLVLCDDQSELPEPVSPEPVGEQILLTTQSLKIVRARVGEAAAACALPRTSTQDLLTGASECAMNAVQHGGGGTAWIYNDPEAGRVQVWIKDEGRGIDLSNLPRATLEAGFSTGGGGIGHGFSLMISTCHRVYLLTGTGGTTIVLEQTRDIAVPTWLKSPPEGQTNEWSGRISPRC